MFGRFFVVTMLLGNQSHVVRKPVYSSFKWGHACRSMHLWSEQQSKAFEKCDKFSQQQRNNLQNTHFFTFYVTSLLFVLCLLEEASQV